MTTPTPSEHPVEARALARVDVLRREWFLVRLSWHLQDLPGRQEKQIRRDLRTELTLAAADVGMAQAVRDLGHPLVLAEGYKAALGRRLPRWTSGAVSGALAVGALLYLALAYTAGTLDTLEALGGGERTAYPFGAPTTFISSADELSVASTTTPAGVVVVVAVWAVAFLLGARAWRVLP